MEQMDFGIQRFLRHLLQRRDVIHDPEAPAIRSHYQIAEMFLDRQPVDWSMGKIGLQRHPFFSIIKRDVKRVFRPEV